GQKKSTSEMIQSQIVTPPFAAIDGSTFKLKTATTKSRTRSRCPSTRFKCGCVSVTPSANRSPLNATRKSPCACFFVASLLLYFVTSFPFNVPRPLSPCRAPLALSPAPALLLQIRLDACRCPLPCAARKSSTARPTSTAAPARRDSPFQTNSAATNPHQSSSSRGSFGFPADRASTRRSLRRSPHTLSIHFSTQSPGTLRSFSY